MASPPPRSPARCPPRPSNSRTTPSAHRPRAAVSPPAHIRPRPPRQLARTLPVRRRSGCAPPGRTPKHTAPPASRRWPSATLPLPPVAPATWPPTALPCRTLEHRPPTPPTRPGHRPPTRRAPHLPPHRAADLAPDRPPGLAPHRPTHLVAVAAAPPQLPASSRQRASAEGNPRGSRRARARCSSPACFCFVYVVVALKEG